MTPSESLDWIRESMIPHLPAGDYKVAPELAQKRK